MSDEFRPIEVVDVGRGEPRPARPPRDRTGVLLSLIAVGVFLGAGASAYTAWTVYGERADQRALNCAFVTARDGGDPRSYDDLSDYEQHIADALDCDIEGR
ncbi:hypothetical protein G5V58_02565 [Nocardioides anomalus]|uniref:Uncharacterized protein n=1 Tax=Nocardioides anomalus TaxID=2712223 RepID=A0A6G6W9I1_9ACTN|nr:hypothetical protein [Nocardioides anomalus]QIG41807.1 hypothetical protein G5V58_02565 [Nocardioides anomalus]